ncbi:uncharacterized protein [Aegilops tauschii subsp. strangulata]|uniref:uncharacterized protein n=1 Tax=Aegilops tauschii subsp. strangulata TaxID=200361 RepID=UPI003CC874BA
MVLQPGRVREWPRGNLALLQYLYWEKVQPSTGLQYDPLALLSPLMRNWTEAAAEKRDKYDFQYGRGVGMIDDTITKEYRLNKIRMEQADKNKKSKVIEKLNKSVVFYKAGDIEKEEENEYGENSETRNYGGKPRKEFVYNPDMDNFKTPGKKNVQEDDEDDINDSEEKRPYYCTPEYWDSFKGDKEDPIEVPEVSDEKSVTSLGTDEMASRGSVDSIGEDEAIPTKRAKRSTKAKLFEKEVFQDEYDVIKASVKFVRAYERSAKHRKKEIFNDGMREGLSAERACKILDHQWLTGDIYIPLNKGNIHWVSVVMHRPKEEFQVLDSLMGPELDSEIRDKVEELRKQLGYDIRDVNASGAVNYPDVSTWPIKTYKMPQQEDG